MNMKQKIVYMAIGCLFTLVGYFFATLGAGEFIPQNASAQADDKQLIDEIVLCKKLMIVNDEGKHVVGLSANKEGGGALVIYNKLGKMVAKLDSTDGDGMVSILNKVGEPAASMGVDDTGHGIMGVVNKAGNIVAKMQVSKNGDGGLTIANKEEVPIAIIITDINGNGGLAITNKEGKAVAGVGVTDEGGRLQIIHKGKLKTY